MTSVGGPVRRLALAIVLFWVGAAAGCGDNGPGNDAPTGANLNLTTVEDTPLTVAIAASDPDGDALTYAVATPPAHGVLGGTLPGGTYTPAPDYNGPDQFFVTVSDGELPVLIRVDVTVTAANDAPVAAADALAADEDTVLTIATSSLLANDTDVDGDPLTITAVDGASHGTVALAGAGITFTPPVDFLGTATFTYTLSDGTATDTATVTVAVGGINDAPVAVADAVTASEDTALVIPAADLLANDTDVDGQTLTITAVAEPVGGTVALDGTAVTFTPTPDFNGAGSFTYTITDGADEATATVTVTIAAVNDPPVAVADAVSIVEDDPLLLTVSTLLANDTDRDVADVLTVTEVSAPVNGTVVLDGTDITFTPAPDFNGTASFVYTVSDGTETATATVTVTVGPGNDVPVAADDSASTAEDVPLVLAAATLLANDTDIDTGDILRVFDVRDPVNGTVVLDGETITFTPAPDFDGTASFVYTLTDGDQFDTATVTVAVGAVNDAPVAVDDAATTDEDTLVVIATADLLANDTDADADTLTVTAVGNAVNGTAVLNGGDITFTPAPNVTGQASFEYTVTDGEASDVGVVTINVLPVNDAPVAVDDAVTTAEEVVLVIPAADLLANDSDIDNATLTISAVTGGIGGSVVLAGTDVTFTPDADFTGAASFGYTVSDGTLTDTGTVAVTVTAVNDAPVAVDDAATTAEDTALVIAAADLASDDTDIDGDPLTVTAVGDAVNGTVALVAGSVTFTPGANFAGAASFTYTVSDGALTDTGTVTVTVTAVNDAPVAVDDAATTAEDTVLVVTGASLAANDTDVEGSTLTVTAVGGASNGTVALAAGTVTFTPSANFAGTASFTYTVSDGTLTDTGLVTVTVTAVNDAPVAVDDAATTAEDTALVVTGASLAANDTDVEGSTLTVTAVGGATSGTVALVAGSVTFTPTANFNGAASFTYTVSDGTLTDTGLVTVAVTAVNDAPIAVDDGQTTAEDTALVFAASTLVTNDTDVEGSTLTVTAVGGASNGTVGLAAGTVTFTPTANFNGSGSFTYTVSDGTSTDTGLVTVTVTAVNDAPVAVDDARTTAEDTALVVTGASLASNDTDVDADTLTVTAVGGATNGAVALVAGSVTFTPTANFNGAASFTYTVSDGTLTDTGLVTVTVTAANDAPIAVDDGRTTAEDAALVFVASTLVANDTDVDADTLTVTAVGGATNGTVGLVAGTVTFTPTANFNGSGSFTYAMSDGTLTDTGLVTVTVTAVNDAPVAVDDARTTAEDAALVVTGASLASNDTDVDADTLTVTAVGGATNGTVGLAAGSVTFTPTANFNGAASFTYTVSDGTLTDTGLVTVTVTAANDAPIAVDDGQTTAEDTALVFAASTLVVNDTDVDADTLTVTAVGGATNGTVGLVAGIVTFTPTANFNGSGSFTYTVSDGTLTDTGLVTVTVTAANDAPVAQDGVAATTDDTAVVIALAATDVDGDGLSYAIVTPPTNGVLSGTGASRTYTPTAPFAGTDTFTFTASDGTATSNLATVTITVTHVTVCGDTVIELPEQCDDGNTSDNDGCNSDCETEFCGDGDIQYPAGEQCDDGNDDDGDGCDSACQLEGGFVTTAPVLVSGALSCTTASSNTGRKIAVDALGNVFALMVCGGDAMVAVSNDRGVTFAAAVPVGISGASEVAIAAGPFGVAYVAGTTGGNLVFTRTDDAGVTWSAPTTIAATFDTEVSIEAFNDDVFLGAGGGSGVLVYRNGARGVGAFDVTDVAISQAYFDVLHDDATGDVIVASDDPGLHLRRSTDGGVTFGAEANPAGTAYFSDWTVGNGLVYAMGVSLGDGSGAILKRIDVADLGTSAQIGGFPDTNTSNQRSLAADPSGNAYVITTLDTSEVRLDRLLEGAGAPDGARTLVATGGSYPGIVGLPTSTGAAILYTEGTQVRVTIQVYP
jgi:cysteine-rich repeat protein